MEGHVRLAEAARRLGVGRTTARKWYDDGLLRGKRLPARGDRLVEVTSVREVEICLKIPVAVLRDAALLDLRRRNWQRQVEAVEATPPGPERDKALAELQQQRPE